MRFELIDRILEQTPDRIVAVKNVTSAEEYLADHFPSFPVLPGVMMLETLVQAGRKLLAEAAGHQPLVLAQVRNIRYGNMVRPGEALTVEVTCSGEKDGCWQLAGVGKVNDTVAVQGKFALIPLAAAEAAGA